MLTAKIQDVCIKCVANPSTNNYSRYSIRLTLEVSVEFGTDFKKCKGKLMKKDSKMWVIFFYISFIIKCEWKKVSGMRALIPFMEYFNRDS